MALVEQLGDDSWCVVCAACCHMALVFAIMHLYIKKFYIVCPFHFYIIKFFSFLYIAASHTARVHYFSCVYTLLVVVYMYYFLEHVTLDFFSHLEISMEIL